MTLLANVRCFLIQSGLSKVFRAKDTTMSTYLVNRSSSYSKDTVKVLDDVTSKVLQGVEFEVEPQEDHTFEVEPHGNIDYVAIVAVDNIYAYESLTFNNTVAYEVISKWKAGLKDDMNARSDATKGLLDKAKGNVLGMEIVRDQSGNSLRVSQSRFYNGKLVQTLLEGHSIMLLEGSLSGNCDVEKNDVGMLDKFDRGLQTDVQFLWILTTPWEDRSLSWAANDAIWQKGLAIKSGFELKIVAGIATGALSKAIPGPRFHHRLNLLSIGKG
ncbi:hypothetical protein Tco_1403129 [Tanacetum coccineum]